MSAEMQVVELETYTECEENIDKQKVIPLEDIPLRDDDIKKEDLKNTSWIGKFRRSPTTILVVVWIAVFVDCLFYSIVIPLLPLYLEQLNVSETMIGVLYSSFSVATLLTTPFAPFIVDKIGKKNTMLGGMFVLESSTLLFAFGTDYYVLLVARLLQGLSSGISWCSGLAMVADAFPTEKQGVAYGMITVGNGLGMLLGPIVGGFLYEISGHSKEFPFLITSIPIILDALARIFIIEPESKAQTNAGTGYLVVLKDVKVLFVLGCVVFGQGVQAALEPVLPVYLRDKWGLSSGWIGAIIGFMLLSFAGFSPVVGKLCDKFPNHKKHLIAIGLFFTAIFCPLLSIPSNIYVVMFLLLLLGFAFSFMVTPVNPELNRIIESKYDSKYFSAGSALVYIAYSIGAIIGPIGVSVLIENASISIALLILAAVLMVFWANFMVFSVLRKDTSYNNVQTNDV